MAVLITGGAGFVGLNIAEALLRRGDAVLLFDLSEPPAAALEALQQGPGDLRLFRGDVCDGAALRAAIERHGVERIVHGAAITADLARERRAARRIAEVNLGGTIEMLEAACRHGIRRVVQLSTGSIFGAAGTASERLDEVRDRPVPETLYGITKYAAERTGIRYRETRGLDLVAVRLGMVFGRWEYDTGVRDTLSLPLQLFALAEQGRHAAIPRGLGEDWVYAADVAGAVALLLDSPEIREPVYHLSSGLRWPVTDWCERLRGAFPGFSYELVDNPEQANVARNAPRPRSAFSIERLRRDYGFAPRFGPDEAFRDFLVWRARPAR